MSWAMAMFGVLAGGLSGLLAVPLLEYLWHARVAHGHRPDPSRDTHLEHHREAYGVPPPWGEIRAALPRVSLALAGIGAIIALVVDIGPAIGVMAGLFGGFVLVELGHAQIHVRAPRTRWERWMWRFHWHHHAADARKNFGLTNPIFDYVFGTAVAPDKVVVPERIAPPWLKEAGSIGGLELRRSSK
jgi:sterol desaturase/sphingolipid hydroxylase (fatty acid hydroxylase superfamily)